MVVIHISNGILEGEILDNEYGGEIYSFKGIPYAQPPVGDLRFKEPVPLAPWKGVRSAKKFGPICHQANPLNPHLTNMSEDCLYLNVYSPDIKSKNLKAVMVWIHGGAFFWGSGDDDYYGPEFIVRHDIVLVTINYRLGAFGFLCLDSAEVPGNAGMKDQVAALRWIKENIANFGGDPVNVTIFGESAGAASVGYHLTSPLSKGLFKRAILQSGATTCSWSKAFEPRDKAITLARQLGFYSDNNKELYEFLKNQSADKLISEKLPITLSDKLYSINFGVVDEKDFGQERFFYGDDIDMLRCGIHNDVEVMTGYTQDEGLMAMAVMPYSLEKIIAHANNYREFFTPHFIQLNCGISEQLKVARKMQNYYVNKPMVSLSDYSQLLQFLSMDMFVHGVLLSAKHLAKRKKVYLYKFTCCTERNFMGDHLRVSDLIKDKSVVSHMDDLPYLFPVKCQEMKIDKKSKTFKIMDNITKLWTNFSKYGNPTPDDSLGIRWNPYTLNKQEYLDIGNELICRTDPDKEEMDFWNSVYKEYLPKYSV